MKEWIKIKGVFVTDDGKIITENTHRIRRITARRETAKYGYYWIMDTKDPITGKWNSYYIHRIVCDVYHPNREPGQIEVNHIDGNKENNHPDNLEWCTRSHNRKHAYATNLNSIENKLCENNGRAKLAPIHIPIIREALKAGHTQVNIGKYFGVSQSIISLVKLGKSWGSR